MSRRLALVIFPDFQLLDVAGPIAVFEIAERLRPGSYDLTVEAVEGSRVVERVWCGGHVLAARWRTAS